MKKTKIGGILIIMFLLAACSPVKAAVNNSLAQTESTSCSTPEPGKTGTCKANGTIDPNVDLTANPTAVPIQVASRQPDQTRSDEQGSVTIKVKPLNLDQPGEALVFDISMETHSVDLSMDLVTLATLTTDNGLTIQATQWDGPKGGHHVEGKLTFLITSEGKSLLESGKELILTIQNVDAPIRKFTWKLGK